MTGIDNKKREVVKLKIALHQHAQMKKKFNFITLNIEEKVVELFLDKEIWWLKTDNDIVKLIRRFKNAFKTNSKIKTFRIKMKGKNYKLNVRQVTFNKLKLKDYHYELTL